MNKLEPVIAFIDERIERLNSDNQKNPARLDYFYDVARINELQMIRTLCQGLIKQDELLQNALNGPEHKLDREIVIKALGNNAYTIE